MDEPLFDATRTYRRKEIAPKLGNPSPRTLDVILSRIPRIAMSKRLILFRGSDLNGLIERASQSRAAS